MKRYLVVAVLSLSVIIPIAAYAAVGVPFGGVITLETVCNTGTLFKVITPNKTPIFLMWFIGELPYLSYIPPHPAQIILGMAGPVPVPCVVGTVPSGAGLPIEFHGSSL